MRGGIDDADHGQQREIGHQVEHIGLRVKGLGIEVPAGYDHDPLARGSDPVVFLERQLAVLVSDREDLAVRHPVGAAPCDEHIGRPFDKGAHHRLSLLIGHVVEGGHELVVGVEG